MANLSNKQRRDNLAALNRCLQTKSQRDCNKLRALAMGNEAPARCRDKASKLSARERSRLENLGMTCYSGSFIPSRASIRACRELKAYTLRFCPEAFPGRKPPPGANIPSAPPPSDQTVINIERTTHVLNSPLYKAYRALGMVGAIAGAYHGYKRNESVGWAIGWGFFGSILPFVALPVAYFQGFGKKEKRR